MVLDAQGKIFSLLIPREPHKMITSSLGFAAHMNNTVNRQWLINGNPRGRALALTDFKYNEAPLAPLEANDVRVRVEYLSFDPSQKGQLENVSGYASGNDGLAGVRGTIGKGAGSGAR